MIGVYLIQFLCLNASSPRMELNSKRSCITGKKDNISMYMCIHDNNIMHRNIYNNYSILVMYKYGMDIPIVNFIITFILILTCFGDENKGYWLSSSTVLFSEASILIRRWA